MAGVGMAAEQIAVLVQKIDVVADLIKEPRGLAEEAYKAGLMSWEEVVTLTDDSTKDDNTKACEILRSIVTAVSKYPHLSHFALMMLSKQPGVQEVIKELGEDTKHLSLNDRIMTMEDVYYLFKMKVNDLKGKFASLQIVVWQNFEQSEDHQMLVKHIKEKIILSSDHVIQVDEAVTVDRIFMVLTTYWSFIDYELLEDIVKSLLNSCEEIKQSMDQYIAEINQLYQYKVSEIPSDPFCSNAYDETKEKLSFFVDIEELSLLGVKKLKTIVAEILSLSPFQLLLYSVQETCITCVMLQSVGEKLFQQKLTNEQQDEFWRNHITALQFQEFKVCFSKEAIKTQLKTGSIDEPTTTLCKHFDQDITDVEPMSCRVGHIHHGSKQVSPSLAIRPVKLTKYMATPNLTNHELDILWEHRDQIIDAITDPDGLAEEASNVGLLHPETKDVLVSLPIDAKTKVRSLLQSIEGKIKGQPILFHHFLALLRKLPGLANLGIILQKTYDEKVTACMVSECDIPRSENANCIDGSTVHVTRDANSYMDKSTIATQQEDTGRFGGSTDDMNNAGSRKVKRPLDKSAEETAGKHPCLEGQRNETIGDSSHSANFATDNPLMKHRPKLAAFYSHQPEVPEGTWPPVKKTQYINLALIRTEQAIDFNKEFLRQTIRGSIDDIMKDKDDIKYDEVFTEVEEGAQLVFEGRPGCGKTTMMNKISQDWAKWRIFSSSLLFLVHLRRLENRSDVDLETILSSTPVEFSNEEFQEICTQIKGNQGRGVVFALDGLDEYCPEKKERKTTFIHKLIKGEVFPKSIVIVASRPAASLRYRRNATKCIEVLGFLKEQICEYIDSYFHGSKGKDSLVVGLKTYLEHHPNVMHMCYLPLHMAMVTYLFEVEGASLPQTETEIYRHFTLSTLLRSIRKRGEMEVDDIEEFCFSSFNDLLPEDKDIFDCILELAFQATVVRPQQVFSAEDIRKITNRQSNNSENSENSLGLVVVDKYFVRYGLKEIYTFLHLTFQEYLSACHIVQLSSQAQEEIILKYGGDKKLGVVWKFYCGMTLFSEEQKMRNFEQLFEKIKYDLLLQLHCAHESQQDMLCTHMVKSYDAKIVLNSSSLNPADFTALGYVLTHSNVPATELAITSCNIGPEGLSALVKAIGTFSLTLRTLSFHRTKIKKVIPEFSNFLKTCPQLCTLILSSCGIIKKALSEMAEMLPTFELLEKLDLSCNDLGIKSVEVLGSILTKLPNLKSLVWIKRLITMSLLTETLKGRDIEIYIADNDNSTSSKQELVRIGDFKLEDISLVFNYFQAHPCTAALIGALDLSEVHVGDAGAQSLANGLVHCTNLWELGLTGNNIGVAGVQALAKNLQYCTNLQKLYLKRNSIGDAGAQALARGLQHCTNLQKLDLHSNNIGDAGAQAVTQGLQHWPNLQILVLEGNNIGDAGAQALAEGLQYCPNLQELYLQLNSLTDSSVDSLSQFTRTARQLKRLRLLFNKFTEDGRRALRAAAEERKSNPDFVELGLDI